MAHLAQVREIARPLGIGFLGLGMSPKWTLAETPVMPKSRYKIMTGYMPKVGTHGLDMMYRTCTVQTNLDYSLRSRHGEKAARVARAAAGSDRAVRELALHGRQTERISLHSFRDLARYDNQRAGMLPFAFEDGMSFERYVDYALDVPMYFVKRARRIYRRVGALVPRLACRQAAGSPQFARHQVGLGEPRLDDFPRSAP
jgi:glutamate--cysteine ligase